jgi:chlorobactene glucosyltransferase
MWVYQAVVLALLAGFVGLVVRNLRDYALLPADLVPVRPEERLFVLIPARNEAENIAACLDGLRAQVWERFTLLVLDDGSEDGTGGLVEQAAQEDGRIRLLRGEPIPPGWAGKVWACRQLGEAALAQGADWILFLDADTRAQPELVGRTLAYAQQTGAGMVSTFPYQVTGTFWERVVLPMLHFLIVTFLPVRLVWESPFPTLVAACGQFELFSAEAYRAVGGHSSIPHSFHDGLQLARRVKQVGRSVRLFDGCRLIACRMYAGGRAVWNGFTRNAYEGLGGPGALVTMTGLQVGLFLLPFVFLIVGAAQAACGHDFPGWDWLCLAQVGLILLIRVLQARRFGHASAVWLHPLSIAALVVIQWASFWKAIRHAPVRWKGRAY